MSCSKRRAGVRSAAAGDSQASGDRLRDRVERAVGRGTSGVRRGIVLGVVLGEDEGLPSAVQDDFRASGLYHLLAVSGQNVAFLAAGVFGSDGCCACHGSRASSDRGGDRHVRPRGWLAAVGRARRRRGNARIARLDRSSPERPLALPRGRSVRPARVDAHLRPRSGVPAVVRRGRRHLRRRSAGAPTAGRPASPVRRRGCDRCRVRVRARHGADRAPPLRPDSALHGSRQRGGVRGRAARPRLDCSRQSSDPISPGAAAGLAALAGWAAAWLELVARIVAALPNARSGRGRLPRSRRHSSAAGLPRAARDSVGSSDAGSASSRSRRVRSLALAVVWIATRPAPAWIPPAGLRVTFLDVGQGDSVLLETAAGSDPGRRGAAGGGPRRTASDARSAIAQCARHDASAARPRRRRGGCHPEARSRRGAGPVLPPRARESDAALATARARHVPVRVVRAGSSFRAGASSCASCGPRTRGHPPKTRTRTQSSSSRRTARPMCFLRRRRSDVTGPIADFTRSRS